MSVLPDGRDLKVADSQVGVLTTSSKLFRLNIIEIEKVNDVTYPITTVPMMPIGISFSGLCTSSATWTTVSRHEKPQFGLINPTMNAMPGCDHPVLLRKVRNTNSVF